MKIISADERLAEKRGAKILVVGPTGVGKTSLLRTLPDLDRALFIDIEAGDLAVIDLKVPTIRIDDWKTARDLACRIGGPNPSFPPNACYSQAHFEAIGGWLEGLDQIDTLFVDCLTAISQAFVPPRRTTARGVFRSHRQEGSARRLRPARARNGAVAKPAAARPGAQCRFRRHPRIPDRRIQSRCMAAAMRGRQDLAASCQASSTRSSPTNFWISPTASRRSAASY